LSRNKTFLEGGAILGRELEKRKRFHRRRSRIKGKLPINFQKLKRGKNPCLETSLLALGRISVRKRKFQHHGKIDVPSS